MSGPEQTTIELKARALNQFIDTHQDLLRTIGYNQDGKPGVNEREFGQVMLAIGRSPMQVLDVPEAELENYLRDALKRSKPTTQASRNATTQR